jgi:hypothetical protein
MNLELVKRLGHSKAKSFINYKIYWGIQDGRLLTGCKGRWASLYAMSNKTIVCRDIV